VRVHPQNRFAPRQQALCGICSPRAGAQVPDVRADGDGMMRYLSDNDLEEMIREYERYLQTPRWVTALGILLMLVFCAAVYCWWGFTQ